MIFDFALDYVKKSLFRRKFRKANSHNFCEVQSIFDVNRVHIGRNTYGMINPRLYNTKSHLYIGSFCSIAENVYFVLGEHDYTRFSTYPFNEFVIPNRCENPKTKGDIVIKNDVWIGMNSVILSGVTIHQGAVIGAGSVVAKDVPPYAIYARGGVLKYRFPEDVIQKLLTFDFDKFTDEVIKENPELLYGDVKEFINSEVFKKCSVYYLLD